MTPYVLGLVFAAFLAAGSIKGLMGVGLPTTSIAIMGAGLELQFAIPILMGPALVANTWQVLHTGSPGPVVRRFWLMALSACIGIWIGTELLFGFESEIFRILLGLMVIAYVALGVFQFRLRVHPRHEFVWSPVIGFGSGALTGITGSLLLPIIIYLQALGLEKDDFVRAAGVLLLTVSMAWAGSLWFQGALTDEVLSLSAFALVPTGLGLMAGLWLRKRASERQFRRIIFGFLLILGLNLIRKGVFG
jgi:uncharacterized membrane protein YfcA